MDVFSFRFRGLFSGPAAFSYLVLSWAAQELFDIRPNDHNLLWVEERWGASLALVLSGNAVENYGESWGGKID